jgi:hypothetical protein
MAPAYNCALTVFLSETGRDFSPGKKKRWEEVLTKKRWEDLGL